MKSRLCFFICLTFLCRAASAQNCERIVVNARDSVSGYYLAVQPPAEIKGVLVLLEGFGGRPEDIFPESKLPAVAWANGLLTVATAMGEKLYTDSAVIGRLNALLTDVRTRFRVPVDRFIIGG